jgi:hypothetical protein
MGSAGSLTKGQVGPVATTPVPCEDIVLRALLKRQWFDQDTQRIKADAFIRDPKRDSDGLSVNIQSKTELVSWLARFNRSFGADSMHSGRIRDIDGELDVGSPEEDAEEYPAHALIIGLPFTEAKPP